MLDERHLLAIERIVDGTYTLTAIAKEVGVTRKTLYSWMKKDDFKAKLNEMQEAKNDVLKEKVKATAEKNIKTLEHLRDSSKNDMTRYHCANLLLAYAGWKDNQTTEITIKTDETDSKNELLSMLNGDDKEDSDKERLH
jgi:transposase-like protein